MNTSPRRFISAITVSMIAAALGFGAVQAFASPAGPVSSRSCDLKACFDACQQIAEGSQPYCDEWGDCQCIR